MYCLYPAHVCVTGFQPQCRCVADSFISAGSGQLRRRENENFVVEIYCMCGNTILFQETFSGVQTAGHMFQTEGRVMFPTLMS